MGASERFERFMEHLALVQHPFCNFDLRFSAC